MYKPYLLGVTLGLPCLGTLPRNVVPQSTIVYYIEFNLGRHLTEHLIQ